MEGCFVFGSFLVLFKVQMTGYIRNLEFIPLKIGYQGCRGGLISQQKSIFVEESPFRSPFRSCEIGLLCCEMALVCQRGVSQLRNTLRNWAMAAKIGDFTLWGFRSHFAAAKWSYCAAKWHSCAKRWFRSCENFRRGGQLGCEMVSQQSGFFAATSWGYEIISQRSGDFAGGYFWLRNFADPCFSPVLTLFLAPNDFPSISLQFLLILIIQKPILHQNKLELKH